MTNDEEPTKIRSAAEDASGADERLTRIETDEADVEAPPQEIVRRGGTFESFRHRDFTWFWLGSVVSNTGTWMQNTALALVVANFHPGTNSSLELGIVNFVSGIPVLFLALPAGALADRIDKRRLLIVAQSVLLLQAAALGILYYNGKLSSAHPTEGLIWVSALGMLGGVMSALTFPAWQSLLPELVPKRDLMNAIALNSAQFQSSRLLGPLATSAFVLVGASMGDVFMVNAASFLFVIAALWAIRPHPEAEIVKRPGADAPREGTWARLTAGIRYARENTMVGWLIISVAFMTVFAMPYMMLLPAIVQQALHSGAAPTPELEKAIGVQVSWLMSANGLGAVVGALGVASMPSTIKRERIIPFSMMAMAVMLVLFATIHVFWIMLVVSALAGIMLMTTNSLTNTSLQTAAPPQLRGRVMALFVMAFMGIMPISAAVFGPLGKAIGPTQAILGGALVLLGWASFLAISRVLAKGRPPAAPGGAPQRPSA